MAPSVAEELSDRHVDVSAIRSDLVEQSLQVAEMRNEIAGLKELVAECGRTGSLQIASPSPDPVAAEAPDRSSEPKWPVNVFGDWAATTGLAEAARRLVVAMDKAGYELSVGTIASGAPRDEKRIPRVILDADDSRPYGIDIWMLNINEFAGISDDVIQPRGRKNYTIATWYWELPTFPDHLVPQMARVDEIWVATRFVQAAFKRATKVPVYVVPAIVPELDRSGKTRADFGLDEDEVVFLFSFDVNSIVARKNPGAFVDAFARAFRSTFQGESGNVPRTRLVMKVVNLHRRPDVDRWLRQAVSEVGGVLIDKDMDHDELMDLFSCADVYVSLHRSEGFGFGIAEAMALGKPVIATAYSGNLDYATSGNSCQVSYRITEITSADHVFNQEASGVYQVGSLWADADVEQAARWMRLLASDPELRTRIGEAGRLTIRGEYSAQAAIETVNRRLDEIGRDRLADSGTVDP
ncbi:MAG: glycosyltransferase family 4 protein [Acidimicrobiales bacterium]